MVFFVAPPKQGFHHLFLDGSCFNDKYPMLNVAAWGVVDATSQQAIAAAPLHGITQTIDRAELTALLAALLWPAGTEVGICLWSDSQSTIQVAEYIRQFQALPDGVANGDLWREVLDALQDRLGLDTEFRWIPSHLHHMSGEDPFGRLGD
jgi:ribonuclease HI